MLGTSSFLFLILFQLNQLKTSNDNFTLIESGVMGQETITETYGSTEIEYVRLVLRNINLTDACIFEVLDIYKEKERLVPVKKNFIKPMSSHENCVDLSEDAFPFSNNKINNLIVERMVEYYHILHSNCVDIISAQENWPHKEFQADKVCDHSEIKESNYRVRKDGYLISFYLIAENYIAWQIDFNIIEDEFTTSVYRMVE